MSRVGKAPIKLPKGVKVEIKDGLVKVEGAKGKLSYRLPVGLAVAVKGEDVLVTPATGVELVDVSHLQGASRTCIANMINGVANGFQKDLDIVGVGYRAAVQGQTLTLNIGYSHPIEYQIPAGIQAKVDKNTHLVVTGADKILVGRVAAEIRGFKEPEPYQGKGIRYTDEHIVRKVGKAATAK